MDSPALASVQPDQPILIYWRIRRPNGQTLACTSYRTHVGLELRAGLEGESPVLSAPLATHAEALRLSELWRQEMARPAAA